MSFYVSLTSNHDAGQPVENFTTPLNTIINFECDYNVAIVNMAKLHRVVSHAQPIQGKDLQIDVGVKSPPVEYPDMAVVEKKKVKDAFNALNTKKGPIYFFCNDALSFNITYAKHTYRCGFIINKNGAYSASYLERSYEWVKTNSGMSLLTVKMTELHKKVKVEIMVTPAKAAEWKRLKGEESGDVTIAFDKNMQKYLALNAEYKFPAEKLPFIKSLKTTDLAVPKSEYIFTFAWSEYDQKILFPEWAYYIITGKDTLDYDYFQGSAR